jgi:hypothetical protein
MWTTETDSPGFATKTANWRGQMHLLHVYTSFLSNLLESALCTSIM